MKAFLFSDSHENIENIKLAIDSFKGINTIFHMGDIMDDAKKIEKIFTNIRVYSVTGNNDLYNNFNENIVQWGNTKVFMTHGDKYDVYNSLNKLYYKAKENGAHIALFGHTHKICILKQDILIINPGSISFPRDRENPTFAILDCSNNNFLVQFFEISNNNIIKI